MYRVDALSAILAPDPLASTCFECVNPATSPMVGFPYHGVFATSIASAKLLWSHSDS